MASMTCARRVWQRMAGPVCKAIASSRAGTPISYTGASARRYLVTTRDPNPSCVLSPSRQSSAFPLSSLVSLRSPFSSSSSSSSYSSSSASSRPSSSPMSALGGFTYPAPRKLSEIVKLQLLEKHGAPRVSEIWREYHDTHKSSIADVLSSSAYELLRGRCKRCPLFVIPIPREGGFFTLLVQFQGRQCLLTFLDDYKRNINGASPYLTITFFDELLEKKAITLVRADVTNMITREEAKM